MEEMKCYLLLFAVSLAAFLLLKPSKKKKLPPGPPALPLIGNPLWLNQPFEVLEPEINRVWDKYGPIVTIHFGPHRCVFIKDRRLAHQALLHKGTIFADRVFISSRQHTITGSTYGPLWRHLRRNLVSEILMPGRIRSYGDSRNWLLKTLMEKLEKESPTVGTFECFRTSMVALSLLICFGEKLDDKLIKEIDRLQKEMVVDIDKHAQLSELPQWFVKLFLRKDWKKMAAMAQKQADLFFPLIDRRREWGPFNGEDSESVYCYADSLIALELPDEGNRKLTNLEITTLCEEFLHGGVGTTASALQWTMANVVKHPHVQEKLVEEIDGVLAARGEAAEGGYLTEEEVQQMKYLTAVVTESLRRHPPTRFVLMHTVSEDVELGGYWIPKHTLVNFSVQAMGLDEETWEEPLEFKPERFLEGDVDLTGSREIKMMPFGAGRRICPGLQLAMLHLKYYVANLVRKYEWKAKEGEEVDLTEVWDFTVAMKYPLKPLLRPRRKAL